MAELCVVLASALPPVRDGVGRYATELTRALIATAPTGAEVTGFVPRLSTEERAALEMELPGLARLHESVLDRRGLALAAELGALALPGAGLVHAPSALAPLRAHDRRTGRQVAVTLHDTLAWTHPESVEGAARLRRLGRRAERFADAIVVPSHAVADELDGLLDVRDRIRVVPGAVTRALLPPVDAEERAARLGLPERYLLTVGSAVARNGADALDRALDTPALDGLVLVRVGAEPAPMSVPAGTSDEAEPAAPRILPLRDLDDEDYAAVLARAAVFVAPSATEGFGLPLLEAMASGVPTVHSDAPALVELAAGSGVVVERDPGEGYPERLAEAIRGVLDDPLLADRLTTEGIDRAKAFSWRDSAEKVWQLHADL